MQKPRAGTERQLELSAPQLGPSAWLTRLIPQEEPARHAHTVKLRFDRWPFSSGGGSNRRHRRPEPVPPLQEQTPEKPCKSVWCTATGM